MMIYVKVNANSSRNKVEKISEGQYRARVAELPVRGKANAKLIELLAQYFNVSPASVRIVGGKTSQSKIVDISSPLS